MTTNKEITLITQIEDAQNRNENDHVNKEGVVSFPNIKKDKDAVVITLHCWRLLKKKKKKKKPPPTPLCL